MKKTHSIHFGKQLFIIEEDAYEQLQQYLARLEKSFQGEDGIADIMEDIEMRFAELLLSYLGENRKVVGSDDVLRGIASLGEPEMIVDEEPQQKNQEKQERQRIAEGPKQRRLFRDSENGMLGGVSAGLAAYFDIDPTIVRILFIVMLFFVGMAIPVYIILWVVLPDVKTPSDRLRMQGRAVTVDTLKEEVQRATDRIKSDTQKARDRFRENGGNLVNQGKSIFRILLKIVGVGMITAAFIWLCIFIAISTGLISVVPATGDGEYLSFAEFIRLSVPSGNTNLLMWIAILTTGLTIGIGAALIGFRLINRTKTRTLRYGILANTILFIFGALIAIVAGIQTGRDFAVYKGIKHKQFDVPSTRLDITEITHTSAGNEIVESGGLDFFHIEKGIVHNNGVEISYRPSRDTAFHISQLYSAHGVDAKRALMRANHISNNCLINGNELKIDPTFTFPSKDGLRMQQVEYIIEVPEGATVTRNGKQVDYLENPYPRTFRVNDGYEEWY